MQLLLSSVKCQPSNSDHNMLSTTPERLLPYLPASHWTYRQTSNISRTISQYLNISRLILQLFLRNLLKPGDKSRMKM